MVRENTVQKARIMWMNWTFDGDIMGVQSQEVHSGNKHRYASPWVYLFEMICKLWIVNDYVYWRIPMGFFTTVYGILSWGTVTISNHYLSFLYWRGTNVILCKVEPQFVS